jgi:hypothetical protein
LQAIFFESVVQAIAEEAGDAGLVDSDMRKQNWSPLRKGRIARRAELYSSAYKLAWEQIPPAEKGARPDISLRIHASIRRELKNGANDPHGIASAALKDVLAPDTL